jgi:hypothetical protein
MNDQTKTISKELCSLLAQLIQSSTALDGTLKSTRSRRPVSPCLNEANDSAKSCLEYSIYLFFTDISPVSLHCDGKDREEILAGSTEETMSSLFATRAIHLPSAARLAIFLKRSCERPLSTSFLDEIAVSSLRVKRVEHLDPLPRN